jgi:rubrerythrin
MSMVWLWNRIFGDPKRIEIVERAEKQTREPRKEVDGGESDPPPGTCRVCGHHGPEKYCPACLADTMVVKRRRRLKK